MEMKMMMLVMVAMAAALAEENGSVFERPNVEDAAIFARWLVHEGSWNVLTTLNSSSLFGYVASYSDAGTGWPYFYLSPELDPAGNEAIINPTACFTLSELFVDGCKGADPQSPFCAKISLTGQLVKLGRKTKETKKAQKALFVSHPQLAEFPKLNRTFEVFKLDIQKIFLVNKPARPVALTVDQYLKLK